MIKIVSAIALIFIFSCSNTSRDQVVVSDTSRVASPVSQDHAEDSVSEFDEYATFFIVISDTGRDYYPLRNKMIALGDRLDILVDTMGRQYNAEKDLIALPENAEDEMYAGDYFPRRFPSEHFSLEYLNFYKENSNDKTIALVAGIYDNDRSADSALTVLRTIEGNSFKYKAKVYTGCMH